MSGTPSKVLKAFADHMTDKVTWWLVLSCGHWYHWTGDNAPPLVDGEFPCPSCKHITIVRPT